MCCELRQNHLGEKWDVKSNSQLGEQQQMCWRLSRVEKRWRMRKRKQKHKKNFYLHFASEFSDLSACLLFAARLIPKPVPPFINIRERTQINNKASKYESSLFGCAKMLIKIWFCLSANNRQRQAERYWVSVRSADGREWKADGPHKK